jgi:hypothetical protein
MLSFFPFHKIIFFRLNTPKSSIGMYCGLLSYLRAVDCPGFEYESLEEAAVRLRLGTLMYRVNVFCCCEVKTQKCREISVHAFHSIGEACVHVE